jgi:hypothetical protein
MKQWWRACWDQSPRLSFDCWWMDKLVLACIWRKLWSIPVPRKPRLLCCLEE